MFKNYLKIAVRNLLKHKTYSFINLAGLAIGIACCVLMLLFIHEEFSYDRFHVNAERIYRVGNEWQIFVFAGLLALAYLTVSYQAIKAALANPVEALRYE